MEKFVKNKLAVRYWLQGAMAVNSAYTVVNTAFNYSDSKTFGTRKDNVTPSFNHQLEVTLYLMTLHSGLRNPAHVYAGALLHDIKEDYGVTEEDLTEVVGITVARIVNRISKVSEGRKFTNMQDYYDMMLSDPCSPVIKGADRINNQGTMVGTFSPEKQMEYVEETEKYILPMLKKARRIFPDQEPVFENIKLVLNNQISLVRAIHSKI